MQLSLSAVNEKLKGGRDSLQILFLFVLISYCEGSHFVWQLCAFGSCGNWSTARRLTISTARPPSAVDVVSWTTTPGHGINDSTAETETFTVIFDLPHPQVFVLNPLRELIH